MTDNPEASDKPAASTFSGAELARQLESSQQPEITKEAAAEAYDAWLTQASSSDSAPDQEKLLSMLDYYIQGVDLTDASIAQQYGYEGGDFLRLFDELPAAVRAGAQNMHQERMDRINESARVTEKIKGQAPELLEGRLPAELENRLEGKSYAIGVNTSGPDTLDEAISYIEENNGIALVNYNLHQRFLITDSQTDQGYSAGAVSEGYYGHDRGRNIIAIPVDSTKLDADIADMNPRQLAEAAEIYQTVPADFFVEAPPTARGSDRAVNPKYIAGFIDGDSVWHENPSFMTDEPPFFKKKG